MHRVRFRGASIFPFIRAQMQSRSRSERPRHWPLGINYVIGLKFGLALRRPQDRRGDEPPRAHAFALCALVPHNRNDALRNPREFVSRTPDNRRAPLADPLLPSRRSNDVTALNLRGRRIQGRRRESMHKTLLNSWRRGTLEGHRARARVHFRRLRRPEAHTPRPGRGFGWQRNSI